MTIDIVFEFMGGLAMFIYGMNVMGAGLQKAAGDRLKRLLEILTSNRLMGVLVGAVITAIIQSSSATTVMVVGFVNAGLMSLMQAAGVIMGANIGTTVTAQLVAFKLTDIAPVVVAVGVALLLFGSKRKHRQLGEILTGFGILFIGMHLMSSSMKPLRELETFANIMASFGRNRFLGVLAGFGITAIIQSSSASIGILQALAANNLVTLNIALPILFGQNIGTCVTALISSIGTNLNARRTAVIHAIFNVIGTGIFIWITGPVVKIVGYFGGDTMRQIANAHTLFNITNTLLLLPFASLLVIASKRIVPGQEEDETGFKYLDRRILETPSIAVVQTVKEVVRMGRISQETLKDALDGFIQKDEKLLNSSLEKEKKVNQLNRELTQFLVDLSNTRLSSRQNDIVTGFFHTISDIERIGDHAENIVELGQNIIDNHLTFSEMGTKELQDIADYVYSMVDDVITALGKTDFVLAKDVRRKEDEVDRIERELRLRHIGRLNKHQCVPSSGIIFLDVISNLERIADHCSNIALAVLDREK